MPEFYIKKGLADVDLKQWLEENKDEPFIRVSVEVESSHDKLRRSFHALLDAWFTSGEWSCNGSEIKSYEKFRNYYKLAGCNNKPKYYVFKNDKFKTLEELTEAYPQNNYSYIGLEPKGWEEMTKKQKSISLDVLLSEIKYSMTNNIKVMEWVSKISGDIESLNSINYHKNIGSK